MEVSELRIGNLVNFMQDDTVFTVTEISENGLSVANETENTWIDIDQFSGVYFTDKWFEAFGFTRNALDDDIYFYELPDFNAVEFYSGDRRGYIEAVVDFCGTELKRFRNIHDFQNMYHALTGKELTPLHQIKTL